MRLAPGEAPISLREAVSAISQGAAGQYGQPMVEVTPVAGGIIGFVAVPKQAQRLREVVAATWPGAVVRVLTLSERRARVALRPGQTPLEVWRRPPGVALSPAPELTTQLLPGDPPAEVIAFRGPHLLVRAPGQAIGWVTRDADFAVVGLAAAAPSAPDPDIGSTWSIPVLLATAIEQEGRPYVWGGTGGDGVDCSGLVWRAFMTAGLLLPRNSRAQRRLGIRVARHELAPGDLVGAVSRGPRRTSHVALALSAQEVIHACSERGLVRREPLADFERRYRILTLRRIPGGCHPG